MKTLAVFFASLLTVLLGTSLYAQTPPAYDDFPGKYLDPGKWFSNDSSSSNGVTVLEDVLGIKQYTSSDGTTWTGVNMGLRAYGDDLDGGGQKRVWKQIWMTDGSRITTMTALIQTTAFTVTGCAVPLTSSDTKIRMGGAFFNTGQPNSGNQTNDVYAFIGVGVSSDDPKKLEVRGKVFRCDDSTCTATTPIGDVEVGTAKLNKKPKLRLTWDQAGDGRFVFQMNNLPEQSVALTTDYPNTSAPNTNYGGGKRFQILHELANCPAPSPRTVASLNVGIDKLWIVRSTP